jgi:hypothetical protein
MLLLSQEVALEEADLKLTPKTKVGSSFRSTDCGIANVCSTDIN